MPHSLAERRRRDKEWEEYINNNKDKSTKEMAKEIGCNIATVNRHKEKMGIQSNRGRKRNSGTSPKPCKVTLHFTKDSIRILDTYSKLMDIGNFKNTDKIKIANIDISAVINFALYYLLKSHKAIEGYLSLSKVNTDITEELLRKYNIDVQEQQRIIVEQISEYNRALRKHDEEFLYPLKLN